MREFIRKFPDGACFFVAKEKGIPLIVKPHLASPKMMDSKYFGI